MASIYPKARSPFWYVIFRDKDGKHQNRSTGFRRDSAKDTAKARIFVAEMSANEPAGTPAAVAKDGWEFVPKFLAEYARPWAVTIHRLRFGVSFWLCDFWQVSLFKNRRRKMRQFQGDVASWGENVVLGPGE